MGYIKKLKNNELVGGTDKTTIYPVTSAEAVFEEVSDGEFKSQKYLNNHITNERIVDNTIENDKLKDDTIDMGKLNTQLKTIIQNAYDASWKVKEEPFSLETKYDANDVVYDPDTNSSYVSLTADNQGNPVNPEDEGYVEGKWRIIINGISAVESTEVINAKVTELEEQVDGKIDDAQDQLDQMIADAAASLADAESDARGAAAEASAVVANKVADAQIGYFECNTATGTALKQTTLDYIGTGNDKSYYTIPAAGSNVRIKMKYANTASGTAELQFGTNTATRKQLIYNGEPASDSNSWDAGEVLSIYYDPTYNNNVGAYQATNAMGGGSAVGKKKLTPSASTTGKYIATNDISIGAVQVSEKWDYIKYPVKEGDVVSISGNGANTCRLWAIANSSNVILARAEGITANAGGVTAENLALVMPEEAAWIVLNNNKELYPDYEWYWAKRGTLAAHEMLIESYIYGNKEMLKVGHTYAINDTVHAPDRRLLRITKEISTMTATDIVSIGDLKTYGTEANAATYQAQKAMKAYSGSTTYSENDFALGSPAGAVVVVTVDSEIVAALTEAVDITVTIAGVECSVSVTSESDAASIAADIQTAFGTQTEWTLTVDSTDNYKLNLISNVAKDTTPVISSEVGESGVTVEFVEDSAYAGSTTLSQFDGSSWSTATLADYAADAVAVGETDATKMWKTLTVSDIITAAAKQNDVTKEIDAAAVWYSNELFDLDKQTVMTNNTTYFSYSISSGIVTWTVIKKDTNTNRQCSVSLPTLQVGRRYILSFKYRNNITSSANVHYGVRGSGTSVTWKGSWGSLEAASEGVFTKEFLYNTNMQYFYFSVTQDNKNQYIQISDISLCETISSNVANPKAIEAHELSNENREDIRAIQEYTQDLDKWMNPNLIPSIYAINENGKYGTTTTYYHYSYKAKQGEQWKIETTGIVRYCLASTHSVTAGRNIDLLPDTSVVTLSNKSAVVEIPEECYILIFFYSGTNNVYILKGYADQISDIEYANRAIYEEDVTETLGSWQCDDSSKVEIDENTWTLKGATDASSRIYLDCRSLTNGYLYRIRLKITDADHNGSILSNLGYGSSPSVTWASAVSLRGGNHNVSYPYGDVLDVVVEKTSSWSYLYFGSYSSRTDYPVVATINYSISRYASFSKNFPSLENNVNVLKNTCPIPSTLPPNYTFENYRNLKDTKYNNKYSQGGCVYGNYFVQSFTSTSQGLVGFRIYDLLNTSTSDFETAFTVTVDNVDTHCNTISFSRNKYSEDDLFPLLYVPSGYVKSGTSDAQVYVVRFVGNDVTSMTAELIQTITLKDASWPECVCDDAHDWFWIIDRKYVKCYAIPDISSPTVEINSSTPILHGFNMQPFRFSFGATFVSGQGLCYNKGRIWRISGVPATEREGSTSARISVFNVKNSCLESEIFLEDAGLVPENTATYEPESLFIWNNGLYAAYRGFIVKIKKIDLV